MFVINALADWTPVIKPADGGLLASMGVNKLASKVCMQVTLSGATDKQVDQVVKSSRQIERPANTSWGVRVVMRLMSLLVEDQRRM